MAGLLERVNGKREKAKKSLYILNEQKVFHPKGFNLLQPLSNAAPTRDFNKTKASSVFCISYQRVSRGDKERHQINNSGLFLGIVILVT